MNLEYNADATNAGQATEGATVLCRIVQQGADGVKSGAVGRWTQSSMGVWSAVVVSLTLSLGVGMW
jgi:hypothetical protein